MDLIIDKIKWSSQRIFNRNSYLRVRGIDLTPDQLRSKMYGELRQG